MQAISVSSSFRFNFDKKSRSTSVSKILLIVSMIFSLVTAQKIFQPGPYVNVFMENFVGLSHHACPAYVGGKITGFDQKQIVPVIIKPKD